MEEEKRIEGEEEREWKRGEGEEEREGTRTERERGERGIGEGQRRTDAVSSSFLTVNCTYNSRTWSPVDYVTSEVGYKKNAFFRSKRTEGRPKQSGWKEEKGKRLAKGVTGVGE